MVSSQLCDRVKALVGQIKEPYELTEQVIVPAGQDYILDKYLKEYLALPEQEKEAIIDRLHQGWQEWGEKKGFDDREVRAWGRASIGAANLFCFTDIAELRQNNKLELAADVIVRISRWFQTQSNFWMPMRPHATELVKKVWGNLEDLRRTVGVCENATAQGPLRSRPSFRYKWETPTID